MTIRPDDSAVPAAGISRTDDVAPQVGTVKWFDADRGFGFVVLERERRDAFIHVTVLHRDGFGAIVQGDRVTCAVGPGPRGLQVDRVMAVDRLADETSGTAVVEGRVKFYDLERGYGFVVDQAGAEIFVGSKTLKRLGLSPLRADQRVKVTTVRGERGPVAETITFLA